MSNLLLVSCLVAGLAPSLASGVAPSGGKLVPEAVQVDSIGATKIMRSEPLAPEVVVVFNEKAELPQMQEKKAELPQTPFSSYTINFSYPPLNPTNYCIAAACTDSSCTSYGLSLTKCVSPPLPSQVFMIGQFSSQGTTAANSPLTMTTSLIYWNNNNTLAKPYCLSPPREPDGTAPNVTQISTATGYLGITLSPCCSGSDGAYAQVWNYNVDFNDLTFLTLNDNNKGTVGDPSTPACLTYGDPSTETFHMYPCTDNFDVPIPPSNYSTQKFAITSTPTTGWPLSTLHCSF